MSSVVLLLAFAPLPFPKPAKPAPLEGLWEVGPSMRFGRGEEPPHGKTFLRIEKGKWTFLKDGKTTSEYAATLDDKAATPTLDLGRGGKEVAYLGIYHLEGDTLRWSYTIGSRREAKRPTSFVPANGMHLTMKFRRAKEPKK